MSNTRIIYVTTVDLTVRFLLLAQLRHLQQAGYQVSAVCAPGPWTEEIRAAGIGVHPVDLRRQIAPLADLAALVAWCGTSVRCTRNWCTPHAKATCGRLAAAGRRSRYRGTEHGFYFTA